MATIGNVVVSVFASDKNLKKSLLKAQRSIKKFAKKAVSTLKSISVGLSVGVAAGVAALTVMINKYAAEIDSLAKTSSKLGITVTALQKLQYQATLTGLGAEKFNKAFNKMTTVIADADNGLSTAVRAFDKLGLNIEYIKSLSAEKQFYAIAEAMKGVSNQTEKLGLAKDIFGAGATGILNTLNSNLQQTSKEFDSLGISITQSGARMVEAYNDSKTKLSAIFSGFGLQLTAQLAAPFKILIQWITNLAQQMGGLDVLAKKFATAFINGIASIIKGGAEIFRFIKKIQIVVAELSAAWLHVAQIMAKVKLDFKKADALELEINVNDKKLAELRKTFIKFNKDLDKKVDNKVKKLIDALGGNSGTGSGGGKSKQEDGILIIPEHSKALTKAANDAIIMGDATKKAAENTTKLAEAANKATQAIIPQKKNVKELSIASFDASFAKSTGGLSGTSQSKTTSGTVSSIQQYIDASPAGTAMQQMRQGGAFTQTGTTQKVSIELTTDTGKIAGEIFAEPKFVASLKSFNARNTNQAARMAAQ